jgi:hypothetical protein
MAGQRSRRITRAARALPAAELNTRTWFEPLSRASDRLTRAACINLGCGRITRINRDADVHADLHLQAAPPRIRPGPEHARAEVMRAAVMHQLGTPTANSSRASRARKSCGSSAACASAPGVLRQDVIGTNLEPRRPREVGNMDQQHRAAGLCQARMGDA